MKTLTAFWHWVDNEKPAEVLFKHLETLSPVAQRALDTALELVEERVYGGDADGSESMERYREHWPALRELSLALCRALEAMYEKIEPSTVMDTLREMYPEPIPGDKGDVAVQGRDGLGLLRPMRSDELNQMLATPKDNMFRREYLGEWVRPEPAPGYGRVYGIDLGAEPRATDAQLSAPVGDGVTDDTAALQGRAARSGYYAVEIRSTVSAEDIERLRGLRPDEITLRGRPEDYAHSLRYHMALVIAPMLDRAIVKTPDCSETLRAWGL